MKNLLAENMRRFGTKNLPEDQINEMYIDPHFIENLVNLVTRYGLPAWTALPIGIGMVAIPLAAIGGGFSKVKDAIKNKIQRNQLTPEEAEKFAIEVETMIKDIPGKQRAYLTKLLNSYKQALAAEAGGIDNITNISGDDAKDIMIKYMDELKHRLPELSKEK
jgi:hypothetical protein